MDKYGVMPESVVCKKCGGFGQIKVGRKQYTICPECKGLHRSGGAIPNPEKEAEILDNEIKESAKNDRSK